MSARSASRATGSYGAGLARHLAAAGIEVLEVDRPDRSDRRRKGKDDDLDAISAARAALYGQRTSIPKGKDGSVESLRVLRVTHSTAVRAGRNALQVLRMTIVSAPEELRDQVRNLTRMQLIRTCADWRPDTSDAADPASATRIALKSLARRMLQLGDEIAMLEDPDRAHREPARPAAARAHRDRRRDRRAAAGNRRRQPPAHAL